jgi:hypothetical protein
MEILHVRLLLDCHTYCKLAYCNARFCFLYVIFVLSPNVGRC